MEGELLNGRYRILLKPIGSGGFGNTFLAEDTQMPSRRRCAIKQLKPISEDTELYQLVQERFEREAVTLEKLGESSQQIPSLYAYFQIDGQFYLVQEWIDGETTGQLVAREGHLNEKTALELLLDLLPILDAIHRKGIIHRDIKPDNIIQRRSDSKPVLIDFGAVKETMNTQLSTSGRITKSIAIGTPGFMPSEQAIGRPVFASDLYALGLTAIYWLTGKVPQELDTDPNSGEILWQQYAPCIGEPIAACLNRAIKLHPRDRFSTADEMLQFLQQQTLAPVQAGHRTPQTVLSLQPAPTVIPSAPSAAPTHSHPSKGLSDWQKAAIAGSLMGSFVFLGMIFINQFQSTGGNLTEDEPVKISEAPTPEPTPEPAPAPAPTYYEPDGQGGLTRIASQTTTTAAPTPAPAPAPTATPTPAPILPAPTPAPIPAPTPTPTPIPPSSVPAPSISQAEVRETLNRWFEAKPRLFGPSYDVQLASTVSTGERYRKAVGAINWLQENNAYYVYHYTRLDSIEDLYFDGEEAVTVVSVTQDLTLYANGKVDPTNTTYGNKTERYRFRLRKDGGVWKISQQTDL